MDPDANLRAIRAEVETHLEHGDGDVDVLVEHVKALDEWLARGGFKPAAWSTRDQPRVNDRLLAGQEAVEHKTRRLRPVRRDDATHPRELPDPADEAAHARRLTGEDLSIGQLLAPTGAWGAFEDDVLPQRSPAEVAARRAAREQGDA